MKQITTWVVGCVVVASTTHAYAAEHLMRIDEILLSKNADTNVQYVELIDLGVGGESFPNGPYKLELFAANGVSQGSTSLTLTPTPVTGRYIATAAADTAFGTTRQDTLATPLPANGQLCFENANNVMIDCVAWGCVPTLVKTGETRIPSPPDGMSVQRQTDGTFQIATPTPHAANIAGTPMAACPTNPMDMPPDAGVPLNADAGAGGGGGNNGCCNVDGKSGAAGTSLLAAILLVALRRRRQN